MAVLVVVGILWGRPAVPPQPSVAAQSRQTPAYSASATAILVDVVVRDRQGRPVLDLRADEFEVFEDGIEQTVESFTRVTRGGGIGIDVKWRKPTETVAIVTGDPPPDAPPPAAPVSEDSTTALVFDHLSSDALALAQNATLEYVPGNGTSETSVAVFSTGTGFRVLQAYTTDRAAIREAVRRVLPAGTTAAEQSAERRDQLRDRHRQLSSDVQTTGAGAAAGTVTMAQMANEIGAREQELRLIELERSMIDSFDATDRDHRGYDTTRSLTTVIRTLVERPGRKSVVFFSEGLPVSPVLAARLDTVIDLANRANVTVYTIDARGLRTKSSLVEPRKEVLAFGEQRLQQLASGTTRVDSPLLLDFERVEDTMRLDSRVGLARLAGDTGGFLVDGSNDLSRAFQRIDEDNRFHYMLTYSPRKPLGDGRFRTIQVKVSRPGVEVYSRKGYRAVAAPRNFNLLGVEAPALAMLNRAPLPNAFPIGAAAFSFPDPRRPGTAPIVVRVSTDSLTFDVDHPRSSYSAQVAVVVRVKNSDGQPVQTLSQEYVLSGDLKDMEAAKRGEILFYRQPDLEPGVYTIEAVALDIIANHGSVRMSTLTVPPVGAASIGMSSLVLVSRSEDVTDASTQSEADAPLYVGRTLLYPNVGQPIVKAVTPEVPFYFALYGDVQAVSEARVQLLKQGQAIAEGPLALPPAVGARLQHVGRVPVAALPPGTYELRVRVAAGNQEVSRTAFFTLQE
jgi:VWFA-related protein